MYHTPKQNDTGRTDMKATAQGQFKNPLKVKAGRKGGLATLERHGSTWLREKGKLGGRPRDLTCDEIRQQQRLEQNNNHKEAGTSVNNLRTLKAHLKLSQRSTDGETIEAGIAQETPREQVPARKGKRSRLTATLIVAENDTRGNRE